MNKQSKCCLSNSPRLSYRTNSPKKQSFNYRYSWLQPAALCQLLHLCSLAAASSSRKPMKYSAMYSSSEPSIGASSAPSAQPSSQPSSAPSAKPSSQPNSHHPSYAHKYSCTAIIGASLSMYHSTQFNHVSFKARRIHADCTLCACLDSVHAFGTTFS